MTREICLVNLSNWDQEEYTITFPNGSDVIIEPGEYISLPSPGSISEFRVEPTVRNNAKIKPFYMNGLQLKPFMEVGFRYMRVKDYRTE